MPRLQLKTILIFFISSLSFVALSSSFISVDGISRAGGGGGGSGGGSGSSSRSSKNGSNYAFKDCSQYNISDPKYKACKDRWLTDSLFSLLIPLITIYVIASAIFERLANPLIKLNPELYLKIRGKFSKEYSNKQFTNNSKTLSEIGNYCPDFKNIYYKYQLKDDQIWNKSPLETEQNPQINDNNLFNNRFNRQEFLNNAMQIFFDYQNDWSRGNLNNSRNYMTANCFKEQSKIFKKQINCFQDVVIEPEILGISISKTGFNTCTIQINAKMINILINPKSGMVIRGNQIPREFTEFWSFELISQPTKKLLLKNIQQI